jgi:hypothetical protein
MDLVGITNAEVEASRKAMISAVRGTFSSEISFWAKE